MEFFAQLLDTSDFSPRWYCGSWSLWHGWLHILSDLGVWSAYVAIPCVLGFFVLRRKDIPFRSIFWLFGAFILACGTTHLMEAIIFWWPAYRLAGLIKLFTATISWATVVALVPIVPLALAMRSPEELEREIADRNRSEQALRESEGRFRGTFENAAVGIAHKDADGRWLRVNERYCEIVGYTREELLHKTFKDITHPDGLAAELERYALLMRGELPRYSLEMRYIRKDGSTVWTDVSISLQRDAAGEPSYAIAILQDISESKRLDGELLRAKESAEAASQAKDRFLAVLSHELRTPLTPVLMAVSALVDDTSLAPMIRPTLQMIFRNIEMEARLIDDLLDLSRIGRGGLRLERRPVDAHDSARQAAQIYGGELGAERLELVLDLAAPAHHVRADPARLQQVVWNLIQNAVKFTPTGGSIWVRSRNVEGPGAGQTRLIIEVSDTGIGIEPQILPRIFDAFEQGEDALRRRAAGLGLGLAISRSLAQAHGGNLTADSPGKGQGSTFTLELPTIPRPSLEAPPAATAGGDRSPQRPLRILLVEDNKDTLKHFALILRLRGHDVRTAERLAEALDAAASGRFDLVISDIELPDGTGLELMRTLGAQAPPGIAMSGYGTAEDVQQSRAAGYDEHLTKPVSIQQLEEVIRRVTAGNA